MGFYGMGQAFTLRSMPRQQVFFGRPAARGPIISGGNYSSTTNITYKGYGGAQVWGGVVGMGLQSLFGFLGMRMQNKQMEKMMATQQTQQTQGTENKGKTPLENLRQLYGERFNIVQDPDGNFTAVSKDGKTTIRGTYDEIIDQIKKLNTKEPEKEQKVKPQGEPKPDPKPEPEAEPKVDDKYKNGMKALDAAKLTKGTAVTFNDNKEGGGSAVQGFKLETVSDQKSNEGFPKTYTFKRGEQTITARFVRMDNGEAIYKAGADEYRLEKVGDQVQFNQHADDTITGTGQVNTKWKNGQFLDSNS